MGALYMVFEGLWLGWTHISMLVIDGLGAFLIGRLNEHPAFYDSKMWRECLIGTVIIFVLEFTALWFFLIPLAIYVDDYLRYKLFGEKKPIGILQNYKDLITGN